MLRTALFHFVLLLLAASAVASERWIDTRVIAKTGKAELVGGEDKKAMVGSLPLLLLVTRERGDAVWVGSDKRGGWLDKAKLLRLDQAAQFFTKALKKDAGNKRDRYALAIALRELGKLDESL